MTHEELQELLPAYALDALDPDELGSVRAHVTQCPACQAALADLQRVVEGIGLEAPPVTPPAHLRARVLARTGAAGLGADGPQASQAPARARGAFWTSGLAVAASVALAAAASLYAWGLRAEVRSLRESIDVASSQTATLRDELASLRRDWIALTRATAILKSPDTIQVTLRGAADAPAAVGRAYWHTAAGLVLEARGLPALPPGRVYQVWAIRGGTPTSAGIATMDASGVASLNTAALAGQPPPDAVGVTIEPSGGSATPTLPIVLAGKAGAF